MYLFIESDDYIDGMFSNEIILHLLDPFGLVKYHIYNTLWRLQKKALEQIIIFIL